MYALVTVKDKENNKPIQKEIIVNLAKEDLKETFTDIFADKWEPSQIIKVQTFGGLTSEDALSQTYSCLNDCGLGYDIHTEDEMREFCLYHIKQGNYCAHTLLSIEENPGCEYFGFDMAGWSDAEAEPFFCAEDMIEYVI